MDEKVREEVVSKIPLQVPKLFSFVLILLFLVGVATFATQIKGPQAKQAWEIYLVNFLFWTGIAQGGVVLSCVLRITSGRWGRPVLRISEAIGSFIPISFILFLLLYFGKDYVLPYATEHYHHPKDIWLNIPFVFGRNGIGLLILFILSFIYLYYSLRQDLGGTSTASGLSGMIASNWKGEDERKLCWNRLSCIAPAIVLIYAFVFSVISWDFMMARNPHWYSTLFGIYYFVSCFVGALCATTILSVYIQKYLYLQDYITKSPFHDLGKLIFGFSLFWVYLFFGQYLEIWYGNMSEETGFVFNRVRVEPFKTLSWVVISCCFFFPLVALLPKTNKIITPIIAFIATVLLGGLWLEKFVLVAPSLTPEIQFCWVQILITLGFFSAFMLTFLFFIRNFPVLPVGDPLFSGKIGAHQPGGH